MMSVSKWLWMISVLQNKAKLWKSRKKKVLRKVFNSSFILSKQDLIISYTFGYYSKQSLTYMQRLNEGKIQGRGRVNSIIKSKSNSFIDWKEQNVENLDG